MELTFNELRAKEVINVEDGRRLGKVCDVALCYPENKWTGIIVPGCRGFGKKNQLFIDMKSIVKVGEDVILVNLGESKKEPPKKDRCAPPRNNCCPPPKPNGFGVRNYDETE